MANLKIITKGERTKERICSDLGITLENFEVKMSQLFGQLNIDEGLLIIEGNGTEFDYKCYLENNPEQFIGFKITQRGNKKDYPKFKIIGLEEENEFTFINDSEKGTITWQNRTYYDDSRKASICSNKGESQYSFKQFIGDSQIEVTLRINGQFEQYYEDLKLMQKYLLSIKQPISIDIIADDLCSLVSDNNPISEIVWTEKYGDKIVNAVHVKKGKVISIMLTIENGIVVINQDGTVCFNTAEYAITTKDGKIQYNGTLTPSDIDEWGNTIKKHYDQAILAINNALLLQNSLLSLKMQ